MEKIGTAGISTTGAPAMSVRDFELYHGAVLTKILRFQKPVALRLVETRPQDNWRRRPTANDEGSTRKVQDFAIAIGQLGGTGRVTDATWTIDIAVQLVMKRAVFLVCLS